MSYQKVSQVVSINHFHQFQENIQENAVIIIEIVYITVRCDISRHSEAYFGKISFLKIYFKTIDIFCMSN